MKANLKKIIELRNSKKLSIKRFSEMLGVSTRTIYNWENEIITLRKADLMAIAYCLDVKLNEISTFKESSLTYLKPKLLKNCEIKESTEELKKVIDKLGCDDPAKLIPLLHADEKIKELIKENNRFLEKNSRLNRILEIIDCGIYIKNSKRNVIYVNRKFLNLLPEELHEENILGHTFSEIYPIKTISQFIKLENEVFNGGRVNKILMNIPFDNSLKKYNVSIKPLSFKNNAVEEIIVCINE